ncbi:L-threonylcarbamoyladenylate synthase [Deminuibacter soli]|uniref:L-threonylcarbamoyladenylate synthase n=1 Tax=Deminuibacter soli TaxID=2291815 RepID=A0A3E1NDH2_9BACT|nr:L-threonylcarbamoyladenylate synthase [Deminuibacter soli]RFM25808.1 threonylcarbamoyl-AMP synthase [Deminuibacter soli]
MIENDFTADVEQCLQVLQQGGIIVYPTDTVWGLGCDATNSEAVEKIIALKKRPAEKSFVVLVSSEREVLQYVAAPDLAVFSYLEQAPKPTTVIYENAIGLADNVLATNGSVAMRICSDAFCKYLIKRFRKPIVSTSANTSGIPAPAFFKDIEPVIVDGVDYAVRYRRSDTTPTEPSAIITWQNGMIHFIRK